MKLHERLGFNLLKKEKVTKINRDRFTKQEKINHSFPNVKKVFNLLPIEKQVFTKYLKSKKAKILIAGCGTGRIPFNLYYQGFTNLTAFDIIPEVIDIAKQINPNIDYQVLDAANLTIFPEQSFDIVIFPYNGIDYIYPREKRKKALMEIYRLLKKEGCFIYSTHNNMILSYKRLPIFIRTIINGYLFSGYQINFSKYGFTIARLSSINQIINELKSISFNKVIVHGKFSSYLKNYFFDKYPYYVAYK